MSQKQRLAEAGIICSMCGESLDPITPGEKACPPCEEKLLKSIEGAVLPPEEVHEVRDVQNLISAPYLTAVSVMLAEQIVHRAPELRPETREELMEECAMMMRHHAPIGYAFYMESYGGKNALPEGTVQVILEHIWRYEETHTYLGGQNSGIILP